MSRMPRWVQLAIPNIAASVAVPLAGLVDTAVLGHLPDPSQLAGVALAAVIFDLVLWSFGFLRMATTGQVAQSQNQQNTTSIAARATTIAVLAGLSLLALRQPLGDLGFDLLAGTDDVRRAGRAYFDARILGAPLALFGFVVQGVLLGQGRVRAALLVAVLSQATNVVGDLWLVWGLDMGAAGAGYATAASQLVQAVLGAVLLWPVLTGPGWRGLKDRSAWRSLWSLNGNIMVRTLLLVGSFATFTTLSASMGTLVLAANALLIRWLGVASWFIDGLAYAVETLAGEAKGKDDKGALRRLLRDTLPVGAALGVAFALALLVAPGPILGLLTSQPDTFATASQYRAWLLPVLLFGGPAYVLDGVFLGRSEGATLRRAMMASVAASAPVAALGWLTGSPNLLWLFLLIFMAARTATLGNAARQRLS